MAQSKEKKKQVRESMKKKSSASSNIISWAIIILAFVAGVLIYQFIFGDPRNFVGGNPANEPVQSGMRQFLGIIYKGGFVVPILIALVIITFSFSIERLITINRASGRGNVYKFISKIRDYLDNDKIDEALKACDKQKGSVANVVRATLIKYKELDSDNDTDVAVRVAAIEKEVEEATNLELPMLEQNLSILATMGSVSTLVALFGTVLGMIRAFAALGAGGAPDSSALATGISEALINTAFGIGNAAIAIVLYNIFTTKIDKITYAIDEATYSIVQTFAEKHKYSDVA